MDNVLYNSQSSNIIQPAIFKGIVSSNLPMCAVTPLDLVGDISSPTLIFLSIIDSRNIPQEQQQSVAQT